MTLQIHTNSFTQRPSGWPEFNNFFATMCEPGYLPLEACYPNRIHPSGPWVHFIVTTSYCKFKLMQVSSVC